MFASVTAHATAMLPVMLAVGSTIPDMPMEAFALMLSLTLGDHGHPDAFWNGARVLSTSAAGICPRATSGDSG